MYIGSIIKKEEGIKILKEYKEGLSLNKLSNKYHYKIVDIQNVKL